MMQHGRLILSFFCFVAASPVRADSAGPNVLPNLPNGPAQTAADYVIAADKAFASGDYPSAVAGYIKAQQLGASNGYVEYNLGNAYFRTGELGRAILHLRRSSLRIGTTPEIEGNLRYVRNLVKDTIPGTCPAGATPSPLTGNFFGTSPDLVMWSALASWFIFWTLFGYGSINSAPLLRFLTGGALLITIASGALFFLTVPGSSGAPCLGWPGKYNPVVIVNPEVEVRSGGSRESQVVSVLHQGAELLAGEAKDGFVQIFLPGGRTGFVPQNAVETV